MCFDFVDFGLIALLTWLFGVSGSWYFPVKFGFGKFVLVSWVSGFIVCGSFCFCFLLVCGCWSLVICFYVTVY